MGLPSGFSGSAGASDGVAFYAEILSIADQLIDEYGMAANLRVNAGGALRPCVIVISDYMPRDAQTLLANPTERTVLFAAGLGDIPNKAPDWEGEMLITYLQPPTNPPVINEVLAFSMPLKLYAPGGIIVLYQTTVKL